MRETRIKSFAELHDALMRYRPDSRWVFRGQGNTDWKLIPKAGRSPFCNLDDWTIFESWKRRAVEFLDRVPSNDLDFLAIAQHYGLATRLLDWSFNPLAAAFFAVLEETEIDAVIYAFFRQKHITGDSPDYSNATNNVVFKFKPYGVSRRITNQGGIFTVHNPATFNLETALESMDQLEKIIVDKSYRRQLSFDLSYYGINLMNLFPDLEGLSQHCNWWMKNVKHWTGSKDLYSIVEEGDA